MNVLLFNLKENDKLLKVLDSLNIPYKHVERNDYTQSIAFLLNKDTKRNEISLTKPFEEEMMIMDIDNEKELDNFLLMIKTFEINIPLKAIVTENNLKWSPLFLHDELIKERQATLSYLMNK